MWVSSKVFSWFEVSRDAYQDLREELAAVRTERDTLRAELQRVNVNFDWLRLRYNQLEMERTAFLNKAYDVKLPTAELGRAERKPEDIYGGQFSFEDPGDEIAGKLGY